MVVYLDGAWVDDREARIPIGDRGFLFADGVFETARLHHGRYYRLADHLARLERSAATLNVPAPDSAALTAVARELARRNELDEATLRITLTRGDRTGDAGTTLVTLQPLAVDWIERAARGWRVITAATRRPDPAAVPAELKSLGRPWALLARLEAERAGADDAILLSADGLVTEGPAWNVFWREGTRLFTPGTVVGVLGGITRAAVIDIAPALGLQVFEGAFPRAALDGAEEAFATMTSLGIVPITELDGRALAGHDGLATALQRRYWERVAAELDRE